MTKEFTLVRILRILYLLIFFSVSSLLTLKIVCLHDGWPYNHEYLNWKFILETYSSNFQEGNLFPVWTGASEF